MKWIIRKISLPKSIEIEKKTENEIYSREKIFSTVRDELYSMSKQCSFLRSNQRLKNFDYDKCRSGLLVKFEPIDH